MSETGYRNNFKKNLIKLIQIHTGTTYQSVWEAYEEKFTLVAVKYSNFPLHIYKKFKKEITISELPKRCICDHPIINIFFIKYKDTNVIFPMGIDCYKNFINEKPTCICCELNPKTTLSVFCSECLYESKKVICRMCGDDITKNRKDRNRYCISCYHQPDNRMVKEYWYNSYVIDNKILPKHLPQLLNGFLNLEITFGKYKNAKYEDLIKDLHYVKFILNNNINPICDIILKIYRIKKILKN